MSAARLAQPRLCCAAWSLSLSTGLPAGQLLLPDYATDERVAALVRDTIFYVIPRPPPDATASCFDRSPARRPAAERKEQS